MHIFLTSLHLSKISIVMVFLQCIFYLPNSCIHVYIVKRYILGEIILYGHLQQNNERVIRDGTSNNMLL